MPVINGNEVPYREMRREYLSQLRDAMNILAARFGTYDMVYTSVPEMEGETYFPWYGRQDEEIMVCVYRGKAMHETFHRHDFFFFNFAYENHYETLSYTPDNLIKVHEGELYLGQPFTGYALRGNPDEECIIIGVLVRKETFFDSFLPFTNISDRLLRFFIEPMSAPKADSFLILHPGPDFPIRSLLENMIIEYAHEKPDTQQLLKAYTLLLITHTSRQFDLEHVVEQRHDKLGEMVSYLEDHVGQVSLAQLADRFGYHPNYLSTLFKKSLGMSFSKLVLKQRMERAGLLLRASNMSIEQIAYMLGYADASNFHKAFSAYYGRTPHQYALAWKAKAKPGTPNVPDTPSAPGAPGVPTA